MGIRRNAGTWTEHMDRNAAVEKSNPQHGMEHVERSARLDAEIQRAQTTRRNEFAKRPVINLSANKLPALSNAPKGTLPPSLKKGG